MRPPAQSLLPNPVRQDQVLQHFGPDERMFATTDESFLRSVTLVVAPGLASSRTCRSSM